MLGAGESSPFEIERPAGTSPYLLCADHGGRRLPRALGSLGLSDQELRSHVAWDIGVAAVARHLSRRLDAFMITQIYSRLVIDSNRTPGTPDSIVTLSERTRIPGNQGLLAAAAQDREVEIFRPYHDRLRDELDRRARERRPVILVSLHSFTPSFLGIVRPWHIGVLYNRDARVGHLLLELLRGDGALVVGDNQPYSVNDETDYTIVVHGERRGLPHVELELRQDLIADEAGQIDWAERLARLLESAAANILK